MAGADAAEAETDTDAGRAASSRSAPTAVIPWIGLTGGIGAGKSTALEALERLGAVCLSTDEVVHELYESPEIRDAVAERFGPEVVVARAGGPAALARAAFATEDGRDWLEQLLWPRVGERVAAFRAQANEAVRRPAPPWWRYRSCSSPGRPRLRRDDRGRSPTRGSASGGRRPAATRRCRSGARVSSASRKSRIVRRTRLSTTAPSANCRIGCRPSLTCCPRPPRQP